MGEGVGNEEGEGGNVEEVSDRGDGRKESLDWGMGYNYVDGVCFLHGKDEWGGGETCVIIEGIWRGGVDFVCVRVCLCLCLFGV